MSQYKSYKTCRFCNGSIHGNAILVQPPQGKGFRKLKENLLFPYFHKHCWNKFKSYFGKMVSEDRYNQLKKMVKVY